MNTSGRKGNWNEIAGSLKHKSVILKDKESKMIKGKELLSRLQQKPEKTKSEPHKRIA
jgi:hypothetical protein